MERTQGQEGLCHVDLECESPATGASAWGEGSSVLQQGEGLDAQPVADMLFPATHRPTSLPWAEKLLIDQEEGGGGRPEGVEGAKRKSTLSEWVGIWGGRNPVGRAASPPREAASCERPAGTLGSK